MGRHECVKWSTLAIVGATTIGQANVKHARTIASRMSDCRLHPNVDRHCLVSWRVH